MSNDYYQYGDTLLPGQVARAEDVSSECESIQAGFEKLPKPLLTGGGFAEPFIVAEATAPNHAASLGQMTALEAAASQSATNAAASAAAASTSESNVATMEDNVQLLEGQASQSAQDAADDAALARQWATSLTDVADGLKGAKYYAQLALSATSGARSFQGYHDASGNTFPKTPEAGDEGKYWVISVAGTLTGVGSVSPGDELAINDSLAWEKVGLSAAYLQLQNNLSEVADPDQALSNLGAKSAARLEAGTGANQVAQRDANGKVPGSITGNSATATKLANARTLQFDGGVSGSGSFDGSSNLTITVTLGADAVLAAVKTVDADGSGLDADLLDGAHGAEYLKKTEFDPSSPALVWSGSADTVAMTSLSEQGPGLYLVQGKTQVAFIFIRNTSEATAGGVQKTFAEGESGYGKQIYIKHLCYEGGAFYFQTSIFYRLSEILSRTEVDSNGVLKIWKV